MNKIAGILIIVALVFTGVMLLLLGLVFLIAATLETIIIGAVMIVLALGCFGFVYLVYRILQRPPPAQIIEHTHKVELGTSGKLEIKELRCPICKGSVEEEDLKLVDGGFMLKCPYCGSVSAIEEKPKW